MDMGKDAVEWAMEAERLGAGEILLTSMDCDGTKDGYDIELTRTVSENVSFRLLLPAAQERRNIFMMPLRKEKRMQFWQLRYFTLKDLKSLN